MSRDRAAAPIFASSSIDRSKADRASLSPKKWRSSARGTPIDKRAGMLADGASSKVLEKGSDASSPAMARSAASASSTVSAKTDTQSSDRQAGTTPLVETSPRLGFN